MKPQSVASNVSVEVDGEVYDGTYTSQSKVVTVEPIYGSEATQLGGLPGHVVARVLLREIVAAAKDRRASPRE